MFIYISFSGTWPENLLQYLKDQKVDKKWTVVEKLIVVIPTSCTVKQRVKDYNPEKIQQVSDQGMVSKATRAGQTDRPYRSHVFYIKEGGVRLIFHFLS